MADAAPHADVFTFVAMRPPAPPRERDLTLGTISDDRPALRTPVGEEVHGWQGADADEFPGRIEQFIRDHELDGNFPDSGGDLHLSAAGAAIRAVPADEVDLDSLRAAARGALGVDVDQWVESDDAQARWTRLWDCYEAFLVRSQLAPTNLDVLTGNLRVHHLLRALAAAEEFDAKDRDTALAATIVVDRLFTDLPRRPPLPPPATPPAEDRSKEYRALWKQVVAVNGALRDVRGLPTVTRQDSATETVKVLNKDTGRSDKSKLTTTTVQTLVDPDAFGALPPQTRTLLDEMSFTPDNLDLPKAAERLGGLVTLLNNQVAQQADPRFVELMPEEAKAFPGLFELAGYGVNDVAPWFQLYDDTNVRGSIKPLGIGDLKVVKQKLIKYAAGEVAHIENVLRGEHRERKHRVLDRSEEQFTTSTETEEETTRDTQTTERFELKKESAKTIEEQMSVQAGVTVSASYGPVTFGAHGDFAYSTSTQESTKSASNFAREVVDKSVSRIQKKTREERVTKTLHEVEELNTHGIDNRGQPDNVTGVYRWVDKYYEAQVYNYGKRLMFEFIVPEPAAFLAFAKKNRPVAEVAKPPDLPASFTHLSITEFNFNTYIRAYNVQGVTPSPLEYRLVSVSLASEAKIENGMALAKSKDLVVPDGYVLDRLDYSSSFLFENHPHVRLSIGTDDVMAALTNNTARRRWDSATAGPLGTYDGVIPVSVNLYDINAFFVNVVAWCRRRPDKYELWQIQTFEKIQAAYAAAMATYQQKVAAAQSAAGPVVIEGQNPRQNRTMERIELKKHCVQLLVDVGTFGSFNAMRQADDKAVPVMDIVDAVVEGKEIQFFEQAFEWENMTYLLYPYFWGRRETWFANALETDPDPLFAQFLAAGAARVVLPVHTAYNDAVMWFLEHDGAIWGGGEAPRLNDDLFISLADELRDQTDDLQNATPEGDPWEVILPTTLVYLQEGSDLPVFP